MHFQVVTINPDFKSNSVLSTYSISGTNTSALDIEKRPSDEGCGGQA